MNASHNLTSDNLLLSEPIHDASAPEFAVDCNCPAAEPMPKFAVNCNPSFAVNCTDPEVLRFVEAATAQSTRRAYESDLRHFLAWGGIIPSSPELVARYLAHHASSLSAATLARRLVAIRQAHSRQRLADPACTDLVKLTFRGIRRTYGKPSRRVAPLVWNDLCRVLDALGTSPRDVRDRALLLIGFAGAFRRSELVAIDLNALTRTATGLVVTLSKSKTDQEGKGRSVLIRRTGGSWCPIDALDRWLKMSGLAEGAVFRPVTRSGRVLSSRLSSEAVAVTIKQRVEAIAIPVAHYSGHSLRAGFVTTAAQAGVPAWAIRRQTGHSSDATLEPYIREVDALPPRQGPNA